MPSMATSHGGILYYVVKVPKEEVSAVHHSHHEPWSPGHRSFDDKHLGATSTPLLQHDQSTDSGWDNPFRPDGDLSREADEIVELIKGGKPITPTTVNGEAPKLPNEIPTENGKVPSPKTAGGTAVPAGGGGNQQELPLTKTMTANSTSPAQHGKGVNGTKPVSNGDKAPGQVELQRATVVPASDASQVEHVNLKKKPKCKCCVIQ